MKLFAISVVSLLIASVASDTLECAHGTRETLVSSGAVGKGGKGGKGGKSSKGVSKSGKGGKGSSKGGKASSKGGKGSSKGGKGSSKGSEEWMWLSCGKPGRCGDTPSIEVLATETHEVRCCSQNAVAGWAKRTGCSVWSESDLRDENDDLQCFNDSTYAEAEQICASNGGYVCSKEEVEAGCAAGTGCAFDSELIWTSTSKGTSTRRTLSVSKEAFKRRQLSKGGKGGSSKSGKGGNESCRSKGKGGKGGKGGKSSKGVSKSGKGGKGSSKGGKGSSKGSEEWMWLSCGKPGQCGDTPSIEVLATETHEVRCCSQNAVAGWAKRAGCSVWSESDLRDENDDLQCFNDSTYAEAEQICASNGGYVCSKEEVEAGCAAGTGCAFDSELIWTSTSKGTSTRRTLSVSKEAFKRRKLSKGGKGGSSKSPVRMLESEGDTCDFSSILEIDPQDDDPLVDIKWVPSDGEFVQFKVTQGFSSSTVPGLAIFFDAGNDQNTCKVKTNAAVDWVSPKYKAYCNACGFAEITVRLYLCEQPPTNAEYCAESDDSIPYYEFLYELECLSMCQPTSEPTGMPSRSPSIAPITSPPTTDPTGAPSRMPTKSPTSVPSMAPSTSPPTKEPTGAPSRMPTKSPSSAPSMAPITSPPTKEPTPGVTDPPTLAPSGKPSLEPSSAPSSQPSGTPSSQPSGTPSKQPSGTPSSQPSGAPSKQPTREPSAVPSTLPPPPALPPTLPPSGTQGDPHFTTWKNEHYEYHGQCDMVLTKDPDFADGLGLQIQIRTKLVRFWSYIKSAAILIGNDIFEVQGGIEQDPKYWINLQRNGPLATIGGFPVKIVHVNRGTKQQQRVTYEIDLSSKYPDQKIVISTFKEFVKVDVRNPSLEAFGNTVGLLGDYKTGDTFARDGSTVINDFRKLGNEWQVLPFEQMLFHSTEQPQYPQRCIEPEDPRGVKQRRRRRLGESTITAEDAESACSKLKNPLDRKDCVYDILATQDIEMVGAF